SCSFESERTMISVLSTELGTQGLEGAMPIDPERSGGPSSSRCSLHERLALEREMLHRLALPGRELADGQIEYLSAVGLECCFLGITAWIRVVFIGKCRINFAGFPPTT